MKLRLASDIHTEFFGIDEIEGWSEVILPTLPDDKDTILALAGDIGSMHHPECLESFLKQTVPRFKQVLQIPGNHEGYGGDFKTSIGIIGEMVGSYPNMCFANIGSKTVGDNRFHMATLWTDFDGGDPQTMLEAQYRMNDYRMIANGKDILQPKDTLALHNLSVEFFYNNIQPGDIVITHHMPSERSIPQAFKDQGRINGAYASNLESLILEKKPKLWMHGHTHDACDYMIGDTRILCNPRGYGNQYKKNGYNSTLVVEI